MADENRSPLIREALHWFAVLRDDGVTQEDRQAFDLWKNQSTEHLAAWERAGALWSAFAPVESELRQTRTKKLNRRAFIASSIGMLAAGSSTYWLYQNGSFADFSTTPGEIRTLTLADGSVVDLGSRSAVSVNYSETQRRLTLHWGEAYFTVAPEQRSFIVTANGGETKALGTRFNIRTDDKFVTVAVTEHQVEISLPGAPSERLSSGWQLAYKPDEILQAEKIDISTVEAWRKGRLIYHKAPLRNVLNDIERYRGGFIVLTDNRLGDIQVSAAFSTDTVDAALVSIAQTLPITVRHVGGLVIISGR